MGQLSLNSLDRRLICLTHRQAMLAICDRGRHRFVLEVRERSSDNVWVVNVCIYTFYCSFRREGGERNILETKCRAISNTQLSSREAVRRFFAPQVKIMALPPDARRNAIPRGSLSAAETGAHD